MAGPLGCWFPRRDKADWSVASHQDGALARVQIMGSTETHHEDGLLRLLTSSRIA